VSFDSNGRIAQIRQSWDQGSLLKQLDIIGKTGRNWPIRDSTEQIKLIVTSLKSGGQVSSSGQEPPDTLSRSRGNSTNILRDPHATLSLFAPRHEVDQTPAASVVSPYAGTRPRQRSLTEILGDEQDDDDIGSPSNGRGRSQSPSKAVAPKVGAGKNFQPIRLFEKDEEDIDQTTPTKHQSPDKFYRPNPKKYQHFDFADGSDPQDAPSQGVAMDDKPRGKHDSNWSFDDFVTPHKSNPTKGARRQDVRHWDNDVDSGIQETPIQRQQIKSRPDAEPHFEFQDDGVPGGEPRLAVRPKGAAHNTGLGLYENNLYNEDGRQPSPGPDPRALGNITNLKDRRKDFDSQFSMDDVPAQATAQAATQVSEDRKKAVKMMDANWAAYDESPASQKENKPRNGDAKKSDERGIAIAGDGMGGKKGTDRDWIFGADSQEPSRPAPGKKPGPASQNKSFWDF
jgi:hypothetical protein